GLVNGSAMSSVCLAGRRYGSNSSRSSLHTISPGLFGSGLSSASRNFLLHRAQMPMPNVGWPVGSRYIDTTLPRVRTDARRELRRRAVRLALPELPPRLARSGRDDWYHL